jgi:hypothetical protein
MRVPARNVSASTVALAVAPLPVQVTKRRMRPKDRPAAIVALLRGDDGRDEVVVFPVTSSHPTDAAAGVEIPAATRDRLGLQDGPCWVIVTEVNIFVWPGPDLRRPENANDCFVYGSLPHALMLRIKQSFAAWRTRGRVRAIRRSE